MTLLLLFAAALACNGTGPPPGAPDAAADAGAAADASPVDSGGPTVACGAAVCGPGEYCLVTPSGACEARDGGPCADPAEEPCQHEGTTGCTPARARACAALPATCSAAPSCLCLIASGACPGGAVNPDCKQPQGMGYTIECPFP